MYPVETLTVPDPLGRWLGVVDPHAHGPQASALLLEMLPIPAAILTLGEGGLAFEAVNSSFRAAGLGVVAEQSPLVRLLGARVIGFLAGPARGEEFDWQFGDRVDCRYFQVRL